MQPSRVLRLALAASLSLSAALYFVWSWRWPLVGDASLIHYIALLIQRGWAPYRDLGDMNMPDSYLIEMAAMRVFGTGDLAWRLFDFSLMAAATAAFCVITQCKSPGAPSIVASPSWVGSGWLSAFFSSSLFILIHGRDGLAEGGQRDLTMAVCLLIATAFLFLAVRHKEETDWPWAAFASGLFSGMALTIKPTALLLTAAQLALATYALRQRTRSQPHPARRLIVAALAGYLVAPALALAFLLRERALAAFLAGFHGIVPYYASLGHRPLGFILLHSLSPLLPLVLLWIAVLVLCRPHTQPYQNGINESIDENFINENKDCHSERSQESPYFPRSPTNFFSEQNWQRSALLAGVLFGLVNCIAQARALPYYRYPLLAFLLPLMALDFNRAAFTRAARPHPPEPNHQQPRSILVSLWRTRAALSLAMSALCFGGFILAPQSALLIHRYRWWQTDFISTLQQNLDALGGPRLSGRIQCIDSISGCGNVLYRMRLTPSTGVLSDFLLFGPDNVPIVRQTRSTFLAAMQSRPPQVIVVTSHLHMDGPDNFLKLDRWPAFQSFLATNYTLHTEWHPTRTARWWSREETPASYRIYLLRSRP